MLPSLPAISRSVPVSPLVLSDRLITLAEQASQAGYAITARRLVALAHKVLDDPPRRLDG